VSNREGRKVETGMSLDGWRKQAAWGRGDLVRQIVPDSTAGNWEGTVTHGDW